MASANPTPPLLSASDTVDLLRRYCPTLALHTHEQVASHVCPASTGCWLWPGTLTPAGYGYVWLEPTPYGYYTSSPTHRYFFDTLVGPIPAGHHIHHRCENKACWHPLHLEAVTPKEHYDRHHPPAAVWHPPVQLAFCFV